MSSAVWEHVSQLTSLTALQPDCWRSDLTPQQWTRLADFTQLKTIRLATHPDDDESDAPLRTEHFLPSLLQCSQLSTVILFGPILSLSAVQLESIARLPLLDDLTLSLVKIESAAPLTRAAKLATLTLFFCDGPAAVIDFRRSLPPLPSLTALEIHDDCRLTAEQVAPLNAALHARMPRLTPSRLSQNLCT